MEQGPSLEVDRKIEAPPLEARPEDLAQAPAPSAGSAGSAGFWERHGAKLAISLLLGGGIAWILSRGGLPLLPPRGAFANLQVWTVPAYVLSLALLHYCRAVRWRHLLRPVGEVSLRSIVAVSWIAFAAILISPFRSGEIVRPYMITRRSSVRLWEATGTVGAERVIDGLVLSLILFGSLQLSTPLDPLPDHVGDLPVPAAAVPRAAYLALGLFFCAFTAMALFFFARGFARRVTHAAAFVISRRVADRLAGIVERVADGLRFLPSPRHLGPFLAETMLYWSINIVGVWLLAWGAGLREMSLAKSAVTMGCIGIGILVPAGPGFFGAFQLSTYMALAMFFPEEVLRGPGAAFVFLLYACQVVWHLIAAGIGLALDAAPQR